MVLLFLDCTLPVDIQYKEFDKPLDLLDDVIHNDKYLVDYIDEYLNDLFFVIHEKLDNCFLLEEKMAKVPIFEFQMVLM
jgi:hypothetical protein